MKKDTYTKIGSYVICLATLSACASSPIPPDGGGDIATAHEIEETNQNSISQSALLSKLGSLKAGERLSLGDTMIETGAVYTAASGGRCRTVTIAVRDEAVSLRKRVACMDSEGWFFSKDVFLAGTERD